jgi:hypothetical protein
MLIKCMIPFSIVEREGFGEFLSILDPSFSLPCRATLRDKTVEEIYKMVIDKIVLELKNAEWLNVSVDGWTDKTARCFDGYVVQYISNDWKLRQIPVAFKYVEG